ncbi:MAG: cobyrinate a,c-diamide synthase [Chloroflexota bacterium]|nr:cobyrinate a,c-diamide synthase [Chloroflexota bacterium]
MKGFVVAGTASGVGKTTLTLGLIGALRRRGLTVQPFKVGPDYIDPSYHAVAAGCPCRNLDSWMLPESALHTLFARAARDADLALVEGVMGLFDGRSGEGEVGSTAHVARLLGLPVVLVLDASKTARSTAAMALGFARFEPRIRVVGCLLNNIASKRHRQLVAEAVEQEAGLPVIGTLGRDPALRLDERYLGLVPTGERALPGGLLNRLIGAVERGLALDRLLDLASLDRPSELAGGSTGNDSAIRPEPNSPVILRERQRPKDLPDPAGSNGRSLAALGMTIPGLDRSEAGLEGRPLAEDIDDPEPLFPTSPTATRVRIGVARDAAFSFYYEDNLELLRAWGAELVEFSPLDDWALPPNVGALYIGGGFPELFADRLAANASLMDDVRRVARAGMPIVAECGGLMYLGEALTDRDGRRHAMVDVLPAHSSLERGRLTLGYREVVARRDSPLLRAGESLRGHEFHWSVSATPPASSAAYLINGPDERLEGFASDSILASYVHLHFGADARLAPRFVDAAAAWAESSGTRSAGPPTAASHAASSSAGLVRPEILRHAQDDRKGQDDTGGQAVTIVVPAKSAAASTAATAGRLLRRHGLPPRETERLSMQRIVDRFGDRLPAAGPERSLVTRLVYAAGDSALIPDVRWTDGAIGAAVQALRHGRPLFVDVRMVAAGLDRRTLDRLGSEPVVAIDALGAVELAAREAITRSAAGILSLGPRLDGAVVAVGNAPTALLALLDLAKSGVARPAVILGFPVGFVAAAESKDELVGSGLPHVTVLGTRGGSSLATAAVNFLARLAAATADPGDNPSDERHIDRATTR